MISTLLVILALSQAPPGGVVYGPEPPRPAVENPTRLLSPADIYEMIAIDLNSDAIKPVERCETRYITHWPYPEERWLDVERALLYWTQSLSNLRPDPPLVRVPGVGWRIKLSDYDWDHSAWEALVGSSPYWRVNTVDHHTYTVRRGWLDPNIEYAVRKATNSRVPVERADRFLAKTGTDLKFGGFYSKFLRLPDTEPQLLAQLGVTEKFLQQNVLITGGAVLGGASIVARHNRELQLIPTLFGKDHRDLWRSLDTRSDINDQSVVENYLGTIRFDGKEHIFTLKNGWHGYYLCNDKNKQVAEVPIDIAQDHIDPHDARVITPYKCVSCHGPKGGIRHFDDVVVKLMLHPKTAVGVITKQPYNGHELRKALEDYYLSDLGRTITRHQVAYTNRVRETNGLSPQENADNFVALVNEYFYKNVDKAQASREFAVDLNQMDRYLKQTGNDQLKVILADETLPRQAFETAFADGMKARIYPWERSPTHARVEAKPSPAAKGPARPYGTYDKRGWTNHR